MRVSEIRVNQIRVNQGLGVHTWSLKGNSHLLFIEESKAERKYNVIFLLKNWC